MGYSMVAVTPMDLAWAVLKMPIVDTKVPGLRVAHGFDEPVRDLHEYHGLKGRWKAKPELIGDTLGQGDEVEEMTPNEYFDRLAEVGVKRAHGGPDMYPVPHEKTLLGQSKEIQDKLTEEEDRIREGMRWRNMKVFEDGTRNVQRIMQGINEGKVMAAPEIDMAGDSPTGYQEGGHRMDALRILGHGDTPIPVAITRQTEGQQ